MARTNFSGPVVSDAGFQTTSVVTAGGTPLSPIAGGITSAGALTPGIYIGSGPPTIQAPQGSLYLNTTGSTSATRAYINSTGATTWVAVTTAS